MTQPPSAFDWNQARLEHRDNLPHVRQDNVIYFVTFRLGDSLPAVRVAELKQRRDEWMRRNPLPHTPQQEREYRQLWTVRIENLMDAGYGSCVLRDAATRGLLEGVMRRADGSHYRLGEFVIMPNHVHALLQTLGGHMLSKIVKAWKSTSARLIGRQLGRSGSYWMDEYFDHVVRGDKWMDRFVRYIHENPVHLPPGTFTIGAGTLAV
jgi:putative transposase